ncbi:hypothetical protein GGQ54_001800 [Naumannella cuiyingiana]|uniref:Uncharacterized protein n=1 Tax=Naumannella cuiyingiana TaxID=1347891 RepID=A0A7Z0IL44_9ACTN|nr:hypothetical protein [Naumannella cuiyingiana]NYI71240.1 hypothetical protein [Naumannella cuiyingiana]
MMKTAWNCLKSHHAELKRSSTRVLGTTRTGILLAFIVAAAGRGFLVPENGHTESLKTRSAPLLLDRATTRNSRPERT